MRSGQQQLNLGQLDETATRGAGDSPVGLRYVDSWIDEEHESNLLEAIDARPWLTSISRRVQHYGWRYDYKSRRVTADSYLGPLPSFLSEITTRLSQEFGLDADQAIVNEYEPGQGIAKHIDCEPCFGPIVAMIGLGSNVQMDFENKLDSCRWAMKFSRRGLLLLTGSARYEWTHSIAKRRSDPVFMVSRTRRLSITFRTVITR